MAAPNKQSRKGTKCKTTEDSTPVSSDLDLTADEISESSKNSDDSTTLIKQLYGTISDLRKSHSDVTEKLTELGLRIDKGDVSEHQWKKTGLAKQYNIANSFLKIVESARIQLINGDQIKAIASMDKGIASIQQRMRCIRIADTSPAGWETVNEYLVILFFGGEKAKRRRRQPWTT